MTVLYLTLPLPPRPLWPNARPHWAEKAKAVREYRTAVALRSRAELPRGLRPMWKQAEARVVFYFPNARTRDRDNAAAALKAAWDGIADAEIMQNDAGLIHHPPELLIDRKRPRVEVRLQKVV